MNVIVTTSAKSRIRSEIVEYVLDFYKRDPKVELTVIDAGYGINPDQCKVTTIPLDNSQFSRYMVAEKIATSDPYILSDDDIVPFSTHWESDYLSCIKSHESFGLLCPYTPYDFDELSKTSNLKGDRQYDDGEVVSALVGGIRIIRKNIRKVYLNPADFGRSDDIWYCEMLRRSGWKTGTMIHQLAKHLSNKLSTIWVH